MLHKDRTLTEQQRTAQQAGIETGQGQPVVQLVNCVIYGFQDFVEQVRQAGLDLRRRGDPQWA